MDKLDIKRKILLIAIAAVAVIFMIAGIKQSSQTSASAPAATNSAAPATNTETTNTATADTNASAPAAATDNSTTAASANADTTNAVNADANAALPQAAAQPTDNSTVSANTDTTNAVNADATNAVNADANAALPQAAAQPTDNSTVSANTDTTNAANADTNAALPQAAAQPTDNSTVSANADTTNAVNADVNAAAPTAPATPAADTSVPAASTPSADAKTIVFLSNSYQNRFVLSGFMPSGKCVRSNSFWTDNCQAGQRCIQITYDAVCASSEQGWAGAYWLAHANDWGDIKPGRNLTGAHQLVFWARGDQGGEVIDAFKVGGISGHKYDDSDTASIGPITLTKEWKQYTIDLTGKNLSNIVGGFAWVANSKANAQAITFYVDNVYYE